MSVVETQTGNVDIWLLDAAGGTATRLTFDPAADVYDVWSPDGGRIAFASARDGPFNIYQKISSGVGKEAALLKSGIPKYPNDWSRDGRFLLYTANDPKTKLDLWVLPLGGDRKPIPYLQTQFNESQGQFSPDGHWVAYTADDSGRSEIYVQPFPASGGKWQISTSGGMMPRWRGDGKELFYLDAGGRMIAVEVKAGAAFKPGIPKALFQSQAFGLPNTLLFRFAVTADGKRFLIGTVGEGESASAPFSVVLNWKAGRQ